MATTTASEMSSHRVVHVLNRCIEMCMDGERGYAAAAADARDPSLKAMLQDLSNQRTSFVMGLQRAAQSLGAFPENQGSAAGLAHRGFMGLRRAVEGPTDRGVLEECARGEREALACYYEAVRDLSREVVPIAILQMIESQSSAIRVALGTVEARLGRH
jgi:uncharacterized protein (TIGR02284 family)